MPVIPALWRKKQEEQTFKANLSHKRPYGKQRKRGTDILDWCPLLIPSLGKWKQKIGSLRPLLAMS